MANYLAAGARQNEPRSGNSDGLWAGMDPSDSAPLQRIRTEWDWRQTARQEWTSRSVERSAATSTQARTRTSPGTRRPLERTTRGAMDEPAIGSSSAYAARLRVGS